MNIEKSVYVAITAIGAMFLIFKETGSVPVAKDKLVKSGYQEILDTIDLRNPEFAPFQQAILAAMFG